MKIPAEEFKVLIEEQNLNFPRVDIVFNLDSPSTKVRIIHDYTSRISSASTTLSRP